VTPEVMLDVITDVGLCDELRQLIAKIDALVHAAEKLCDDVIRVQDDESRRRLERLTHLVSATAETVRTAEESIDNLALCLSMRPKGA
jgi:response regulator RpfG family c-di-GMP phosphodiesterase